MPLFHNHHTIDVNVQGVPCPEPTCTHCLPAPRNSPPPASKKQRLAVTVRASPFQHLALMTGSFHMNTWPDKKKPPLVSLR
ncbi:hypothetical protein B0H14DRAFT_3435468 [Mycena olivaceomarginata]|nr:hypothetical protein B0H14DRAFT_3435468 [Mycena olivaceomarginata]